MKTQAQRVSEIWADWNERKIPGSLAMYKIGKIFKISTMREWRRRMDNTIQ